MGVFDEQGKGLEISRHFARFMLKLAGEKSSELFLAAGLVSRYTGKGHICLDLSTIAGHSTAEVCEGAKGDITCPELGHWISVLRKTSLVGRPGEFKPLILNDAGRLYLYRYWEYEKTLADNLKMRLDRLYGDLDIKLLQSGLKRFFPHPSGKDGPDWQRIAALTSVYRMFSIISGGPGTGKTLTAVKILALLVEHAKGGSLRIASAAPTGKAAARLKEAIRTAKEELACSSEVRSMIPDDVSTIHRLLGTIRGSSSFRYNEENPLPYDVVMVDEASMVDLPLMAKLIQAVPHKSRLILLGDKDQLASVEPGAVLGDMCDTDRIHSFSRQFACKVAEISGEKISGENLDEEGGLRDSIVVLSKSYRFGLDSGIGLVSRAVNEGDGAKALSLLKRNKGLKGAGEEKFCDISWSQCPHPVKIGKALNELVIQGYGDYLKTDNPQEALRLFNKFRLLCALRQGPYGVSQINSMVEKALQGAGLIHPQGSHYIGRPVMVTQNDYQMELFNGDIGIILPDVSAGSALRVYFPTPDGGLRKILPARLPAHETVYAMTVHKSQGSEFERLLLLLPDRDSQVLTRELIYTGLTRAMEHVEVWGREEVFLKAVARRIQRQSGLRDALWG